MNDLDHGWLYGLGAVLAGAFVWLRRQRTGVSSDNTQIAEDKARVGVISRLERIASQAEARADAAEARERALADELTKARAAVGVLRHDLARETAKKQHRTRLLSEEERRILGDTGFVDLDDAKGDK